MKALLINRKRMLALVCVLVATIISAISPSANAVPTLRITDGSTTVEVADDNNDGQITFNDDVGVWIVVVSTGLSKPLLGSAAQPKLDLNIVSVSSTSSTDSSTLSISFSDTDFTGGLGADLIVGGTTDGDANFLAYYGTGNNLFQNSGQIGSLGTYSAGPFSGGTSGALSDTAPYSITLVTTYTHGSGTKVSSSDLLLAAPEPCTLLLLGSSLLGLAGIRKRYAV